MGLNDSHNIGKIIIHPTNPDIVYVAVLGHQFTYNEDRGIYKTIDGGETWGRILFVNEKTGFIDLVMDPSDSNTLYAAAWERLRKAWHVWTNGPGSGIYSTSDGGKTWRHLSEGLPKGGEMGRIGVAVAASNPNVVYALIDNWESARPVKPGELSLSGLPLRKAIKGAEVYRSDDRGETWRRTHEASFYRIFIEMGCYLCEIRIEPNDENTVYFLGYNLFKTTDGGKTVEMFKYKDLHGDHQAMWINPSDSNHIIDGNDGGLNITHDGGETWRDIDTLPVTQFYNVYLDSEKPFNIYGSAQDHGSFKGPVTHNPKTDPATEWVRVPGGEANYIEHDRNDPNILYSGNFYGRVLRANLKEEKREWVQPKAEEGEPVLRCTWLTPFFVSVHDPFPLYSGSQYLFKTHDMGATWERISPDLTRFHLEKQGELPYAAMSTIAESPLKAGLIYVGTDDGNVHVTKDGGKIWTRVSDELPRKWVSRVVASQYDEGTVYVTLSGYRDDDFDVYIYKSTDYGQTWSDIEGDLPYGPINVVREDPKEKNILYVGTDLSVYVTLEGGKKWHVLGSNLPSVYVHDIRIHPRDNIIVAGTHGRGFFVMDAALVQNFKK